MQRNSFARAAMLVLALCLPSFGNHDDPDTNFAAAVQTSAGNEPSGVAAGDIDGDGTIDLVFADGDTGIVKVRRNDGSGVVFSTNGFTVADDDFPLDVKVADMDGDQDLDIVLGAFDGVRVVRNDGLVANILQFTQLAPVEANDLFPAVRIAIADYDGDGKPDVAAAGDHLDQDHPNGGYVALLRNTGGGALVNAGIELFDALPNAVAAGDMDADGKAEVLAAFGSARKLVLFHNPGDGTVDLGAARQEEKFGFGSGHDIAIADLTKDGRPDVVVAEWEYFLGDYQSQVALYINTPGTPFTLTTNSALVHSFVTAPFTTPIDAACAVGDVDGDGDPEIVSLSPLEGKVNVLHFDPVPDDLEFGEFKVFACGAEPFGLVLAQMNKPPAGNPGLAGRDTKIDIVAVNRSGNQGQVLINTTPGGVIVDPGPGSDIPPAKNLTVKSKTFDGRYQDGQAWTFTAEQPHAATGLAVAIQYSATPGDAQSWQDLPGAPLMTRGKGKKVNLFTLKTNHVPAGNVYFRTLTSAPGHVDSPNVLATGESGYRGPYFVEAPGAVLVLTTTVAPASDPVDRRTTLLGDTVAFIFKVKNEGSSNASKVVVSQVIPNDLKFDTAPPVDGATFALTTPKIKKGVITKAGVVRWTIPSIAPGQSVILAFTTCVRPTASVVLAAPAQVASDAIVNVAVPQKDVRLTIESPLEMDVDVLDDPTPRGGEVVTYELRAENDGATTFTDCVAIDLLPTGTAYEAAYFVDEFGDPLTPPVAAPGGRSNPHYDTAKKKVLWYLGDLDGHEIVRLRLEVRLAYDVRPGGEINNRAWQLRGCPPCITGCDPLNEDSLPVASADTHDVLTTLSSSPPAGVPILRLDQFTVVPGVDATITDGRYGALSAVRPGGEFIHRFLVKNSGSAIARDVRLTGNIAQESEFVTGSVQTLDLGTLTVHTNVTHTISSGGTLDITLGSISPNQEVVVAYRGRVDAAAKVRTLILFSGWNLATSSVSAPVFAGPTERRIYVANPFMPTVSVDSNRSAVVEGDLVTFTATLSNKGTLPGTNAKITMTIPPGMSMADDPDFAGPESAILLDRDGSVIGKVAPDPRFKAVFFDLSHVSAAEPFNDANENGLPDIGETFTDSNQNGIYNSGEELAKVRLTLRLVKAPAGSNLESVATFTGSSANSAKSSTTELATFTQSLLVEQPDRTEIAMVKFAPMLVRAPLEYAYTVVVANTGSVEARNVVASMTAPPQTTATPGQTADFGTDGTQTGSKATWNFGNLPPGAFRIRQFQIKIDEDVSGCAIVENSCFVRADNANGVCAGPTTSVLLFPNADFSAYRWPAAHCFLQTRGMNLDGVRNPALEAAVTGLDPKGFVASVGGAGIIQFTNGAFVLPLGSGQLVAAGAGNLIGLDGGTLVGLDGGTLVAAGAGNLLTLRGIAGFGDLNGADLLPNLQALVAAGAGNLLNGGGTNLVGNDGGTLVGLDGSTLLGTLSPFANPQNLVAAGGGNLVAAGGGNLVAAGAGNVVSDAGAGLVPKSGGWLVAAGGGNLVAAGAGNLVGLDGSTLVAAGAGNLAAGK